jgi:hypothetical protein
MRSLCDRMRPVNAQRVSVSWFSNRTRWRVQSRSTRHVRSWWELTGLKPDARCNASGQFCSASGRCFARALLGLTSASGRLRDQRIRSLRGARPVGASRAWAVCDQRVRSIQPTCPVVLRDWVVYAPVCPISTTAAVSSA